MSGSGTKTGVVSFLVLAFVSPRLLDGGRRYRWAHGWVIITALAAWTLKSMDKKRGDVHESFSRTLNHCHPRTFPTRACWERRTSRPSPARLQVWLNVQIPLHMYRTARTRTPPSTSPHPRPLERYANLVQVSRRSIHLTSDLTFLFPTLPLISEVTNRELRKVQTQHVTYAHGPLPHLCSRYLGFSVAFRIPLRPAWRRGSSWTRAE